MLPIGQSGAVLVDQFLRRWDEDGFLCVPGFLSAAKCAELVDAGTDLLHADRPGVVMRTEQNFPEDLPIEERVSKLYRLTRAQ